MGRYLVITCLEDTVAGEKENEYVITHDGGLKYYETKNAAIKAVLRKKAEWLRKVDARFVRQCFAGIYDVKKRCWL